MKDDSTIRGAAHTAQAHDSAAKHVTGRATYTDDIVEPAGLVHAYLGTSTVAHGEIVGMDLGPVRAAPGVIDVLTADDIPGVNDISPTGDKDEPVFARDMVEFWGQPLFAVLAETRDQARRAAALAQVDYAPLPHALSPTEAQAAGYPHVTPNLTLRRGDAATALARAPHRIQGRMTIGGQDHMYLEGQIAMAEPGEDDEVVVHCSTQHPSEAQHMVAHVLGIPQNAVVVQVRRMGGGFGGKESQMNLFACVAALAAKKLGRAVKLRPDRDQDMMSTGKRHDFVVDYDLGFDDTGRITAVDGSFAARCGFSADLSGPVTDRALFHADNAYFYPDVRLVSHPMKTNTVSNTAFRGFGGPQGVVAAERMIEEIAYALNLDPLEVRKRNFYGEGRDVTPYHQTVEDNILPRITGELEESAEYQDRRRAVLDHNAKGGVIRKGIALTPVKFGISFTATWYNQAGALVQVYRDGLIHLNHGGTEMGQGLFTKVAQVVAEAFQVDLDRIKITRTTTEKVPNTSATAASSGLDLNGMAALDACEQIKARLVAHACETRGVTADQVHFRTNTVQIGDEALPFDLFIAEAYMARVQLSAAGFYKTPKIHWDRVKGQGRPFYYFAYGAACSEVSIDTLTGEYTVDRVDVLHDVGRSLNPAIDLGQVEGAFVQGMGWRHDRGAVVGRQGPAAHARALDLQDSAGQRRAAPFRRAAGRVVGEPGTHDQAFQGGGRAALHAGGLGHRGAVDGGGLGRRLPRLPPVRRARDARARAHGGGPAAPGMTGAADIRALLAGEAPVVEARLERVAGSAPREAGAAIYVTETAQAGTIGGGQLEYMVIGAARALLARGGEAAQMDLPLGPEIGQCCGGRVEVALRRLDRAARAKVVAASAEAQARRPHLLILGAGHVGRALAVQAQHLPLRTVLIDGRAAELALSRAQVATRLTALPEAEIDAAPPGSAFVVLTHDHALDFLLTAAALARGDAAYVGMIGSATKRARFLRWAEDHGGAPETARLTCPMSSARKLVTL